MTRPSKLTIRTYNVGFGDCFLLSFAYPDKERHVLIDFGTTQLPAGAKDRMRAVAKDISQRTKKRLEAVVVTHRHADHISGFDPGAKGDGPGAIIKGIDVGLVLQPWTERPDLAKDAIKPPKTTDPPNLRHVRSLASMSRFSGGVLAEIRHLRNAASGDTVAQLAFVGEDNLSNKAAVKNLMDIGRGKTNYLHFGMNSGLEKLLPGVVVQVLGPPTVEQYPEVRRQRDQDKSEFWHLLGLTSRLAAAGGRARSARLGGKAAKSARTAPIQARWMVRRLQHLRADSLLELVRSLDDAMNNTSLILLFETNSPKRGPKSLLFPGDAQIENWEYALKVSDQKQAILRRLSAVDVYKVGHHGSLNATPKTLWAAFSKKRSSAAAGAAPLASLVSTLAGKHGGKKKKDTEVPREKLVTELKKETDYFTTQSLAAETLFSDRDIRL